jgi:hypothetical protein
MMACMALGSGSENSLTCLVMELLEGSRLARQIPPGGLPRKTFSIHCHPDRQCHREGTPGGNPAPRSQTGQYHADRRRTGNTFRIRPGADDSAAWPPNGQWIAFRREADMPGAVQGRLELIAIPALGGKKRLDLGRTVSPDEKHLILAQRHYETQDLMLVDNLQ